MNYTTQNDSFTANLQCIVHITAKNIYTIMHSKQIMSNAQQVVVWQFYESEFL